MNDARRSNRLLVIASTFGLTTVGGVIAAKLLSAPDGSGATAPRDQVVRRSLELTSATVTPAPGSRLKVSGRTDLVDGALLEVAVLGGGTDLLVTRTSVRAGSFEVDTPATGDTTTGTYTVVARFAIEAQAPSVRDALSYEHRSLSAHAPLFLPPSATTAAVIKDELRSLIDSANQLPRDPSMIDELDRRAVALGRRLWLAEERVAVMKLRQALEEARRPEVRRAELDRLLVEAHTLSKL